MDSARHSGDFLDDYNIEQPVYIRRRFNEYGTIEDILSNGLSEFSDSMKYVFIHGQNGIGKTWLLNYIVKKESSRAIVRFDIDPFNVNSPHFFLKTRKSVMGCIALHRLIFLCLQVDRGFSRTSTSILLFCQTQSCRMPAYWVPTMQACLKELVVPPLLRMATRLRKARAFSNNFVWAYVFLISDR